MMSAPDVKIKLNQECKRALLNQAMRLRSSTIRRTHKGKKVFKFFKLQIISKSFLYCPHRFEVYRLRLDLPYRLYEKIKISVLGGKDYFESYRFGCRVTLAQSKALLRLFRPQYFCIQQDDHVIHRYANEVYELLRLTDGKIGLFFNEKYGEVCHLRMVEAFSSRIHELKCPGELLEDGSLPKLRLDNCEIFNLGSVDQLAKILRYNIRKLKVNVNRVQYFEREELVFAQKSDTKLQVNTSVESIKLHCDELDFDEIKEIAGAILKLCPNLKNFYLYAAESEEFPEFFDAEFTDAQASSQLEKIMELKHLLSTSGIKPHIKLKLEILGDGDDANFANHHADYWYEVDQDEFADWKAERAYDFDTIGDNMLGEHRFGDNICSTCLTFEDEGCKLELDMTARVYSIKIVG